MRWGRGGGGGGGAGGGETDSCLLRFGNSRSDERAYSNSFPY